MGIAHKIILGIDPGLRVTGFALLKFENGKAFTLDYGHLALSSQQSVAQRIHVFHDFFLEKITTYGVTHLALETPFLGKNPQAFLKLGYLRGILYLLAQQHQCEIQEFAPRQVKLSVTGFGGASKEQVAAMVWRLFTGLKEMKKTVRNDVTDALAISLCGLWHTRGHR